MTSHDDVALPTRRDIAVSITGLSKTFGENTVLSGVNLELEAGRVHGLIGENGSGKSTLIKCLSGVYQPDAASEITWSKGGSGRRCVVVHQDLGLVPGLTVEENMAFGLGFEQSRFGRIKWRKHRARVVAILEKYQVPLDPRSNIDTLSMAQRTLLAMARALTNSDSMQMLILDEPTAALPLRERGLVVDVAASLARQGLAVLYVSHHLDEVVALADAITVLRAGSLVTTRPKAGLTVDDLVRLMSGEGHGAESRVQRTIEASVVLQMSGVSTALLRSVDLQVRAGEIVGLVGAPDSGASDLCELAAGIMRSTGGAVTFKGNPIKGHDPLQAVRNGILLVPSDRKRRGIVGDLSVRENLALTKLRGRRLLAPLTKRSEKAQTDTMLTALDVRPRDPEMLVGQLSGGNQQKVVIGRCLAAEPELLILENPTQGVDPTARMHIRRLIREAAERGIAVLLADVDEAEIMAVADRVLEIDDGVIAPVTTATGNQIEDRQTAVNRSLTTAAVTVPTEESVSS